MTGIEAVLGLMKARFSAGFYASVFRFVWELLRGRKTGEEREFCREK